MNSPNPSLSKNKLEKLLEEQIAWNEQLEFIDDIRDYLEKKGVEYTISDIITISKLHRASRLLGGKVSLENIIISVIAKNPVEESMLRKKLLGGHHIIDKSVNNLPSNAGKLITIYGNKHLIQDFIRRKTIPQKHATLRKKVLERNKKQSTI